MRAELDRYVAALEARHLAELEWPEVTRALRALSSTYVQRRDGLGRGAALDGRGKRAAFAMFYGPLHFAIAAHVVDALDAAATGSRATRIVDLGCGTGAAGAAWALAAGAPVLGLDVNTWALDEARWTYHLFELDGRTRRGDIGQVRIQRGDALMAGYALNELTAPARDALLRAAAASSSALLVIEPIARGITPWWDAVAAMVTAAGGRADDWTFPLDMPERWRLLDRSAGFKRDRLTARTLWLPPR